MRGQRPGIEARGREFGAAIHCSHRRVQTRAGGSGHSRPSPRTRAGAAIRHGRERPFAGGGGRGFAALPAREASLQ